jgi:hypothetical protein
MLYVTITCAVHYLDHKRYSHDALRLMLRFRHIVVQFCVKTIQLDLQHRKKIQVKIRSAMSLNLATVEFVVCVFSERKRESENTGTKRLLKLK